MKTIYFKQIKYKLYILYSIYYNNHETNELPNSNSLIEGYRLSLHE